MSWLAGIQVGTPVYATDGLLGTVASAPRVDLGDPSAPADVIVLASRDNAGPGVEEFRRVAREMIQRVETGAIHLNLARASVPPASAAVSNAHRRLPVDESRLTIPVVEEDVVIDRRVVELGHVTIQKKVDEFLDEQLVPLRHQEVQIDRVSVDRVIDTMIEPYMDGDVFVVPIIEEEIIITRRLRLKEELRVRRTVGEREELIQTPFRRERVVVTEHWRDGAGQSAPRDPSGDATVVQQRRDPPEG